jgi:hypothetical protein
MTLNYYPSESDTRPAELDTVSSPTTVYFRRNIEAVEIPDEGLISRTIYKYEEARVRKLRTLNGSPGRTRPTSRFSIW